jgi:hypothetical protein
LGFLLVKKSGRSWWKNTDAKREIKLFRKLVQGGKSFTDLFKELGWGSQTLTFYLKTLESTGCIASKKHGRNVTYALVKSNPYVMKMLKLSTPSIHDFRIFNRVALDKLDEETFINDWLNSIRFAFLNLLRDYALLGKKNAKEETSEFLRRLLQVDIEDLVDIIDAYGQVLTRRMRAGTIRLERIQEIRLRIQEEVTKQFLKLHNTL